MNPNYQAFTVEEFAQDEQFRQWVLHQNPQSEAFWSAWLLDHPDAAGRIQLARAFLYALEERDLRVSPDELAQLSASIVGAAPPSTRLRWPWPVYLKVASVLLVLGLGLGLTLYWSRPADTARLAEVSPVLLSKGTDVRNDGDTPQRLTLPDGSMVTLDPGSRLRAPKQFAATQREVYLVGQAFFEIRRNPRQPFWVHTDRLSTQVLGTSFRVTTEGEAPRVEVRTGRVSVYTRHDIQLARQYQQKEPVGVVLTANQQVTLMDRESRLVKSVVQQPVLLRPQTPAASDFDEVPIGRVFDQLEAAYGLPILYDPATVQHCYITARFTDESLFDRLNLICRISRASYEIVDGQIIIHSLGCDDLLN
ncbi:FecR family protein [Spirosoma luteolum]